MPNTVFNAASRQLQGRFGTHDKADRSEFRVEFTDDDHAFIERSAFLLATVDADGGPDCSYRGGQPGWVQVVVPIPSPSRTTTATGSTEASATRWPTPEVAMLFIDFDNPGRRRIDGSAALHYDDPLLAECPGAQLIVCVKVNDIFGNCPRYVRKMELKEYASHPPARFIPAPTT